MPSVALRKTERARRPWWTGQPGEPDPVRVLAAAVVAQAVEDVAERHDPSAASWLQSREGGAWLDLFGLDLADVQQAIEKRRRRTEERRQRRETKDG